MERKRLVADRFRRIWAIVEDIANHPGSSRRELAERFALSERQVQADLNIIRSEMRLPLVRRQGYRFAMEPRDARDFALSDIQLLLLVLRSAMRGRAASPEALRTLAVKLASVFPPHLQPLARRALEAVSASAGSRQHEVFAALADALLRHTSVKLHYPPGDTSAPLQDPIVLPDLLVPYLDSWYLIGKCRQRGKIMMFSLETVTAVTPAPEP